MGQVMCRGQECGHLCKAKGSQAEGQNNPRATSSDKHQKEYPAQSKYGEDGNKQRKNRREIWHLPKCHPIKPAAQSGERGNSQRPNPNGFCEEEPIPPSLAGRGWGSCQQMKAGSCH